MDHTPVTHSEIRLRVGLNDQKWPVTIEWEADNQPGKDGLQAAKAMTLSIFDGDSKETLRIDLWTPELQVMEMDRMIYHTIRGLADTYYKATQNKEVAVAMQQFAQYFGEKTEIIPPLSPNK